jgi:rod shape-determining protein MreD
MRWWVFVIFAYVALSLQEGVGTLLQINGITPDFVLILTVFIALSSQPRTLCWAGLILGLLADLSTPLPIDASMSDAAVIGPAAIGYLTAAYLTYQLRGYVYRDTRLIFGLIVIIAGIAAHLVMVAMLTARGFPWPTAEPIRGWAVTDQLTWRFLRVVYAAAIAVPLSVWLSKTKPWWGFAEASGKPTHRAYSRYS